MGLFLSVLNDVEVKAGRNTKEKASKNLKLSRSSHLQPVLIHLTVPLADIQSVRDFHIAEYQNIHP